MITSLEIQAASSSIGFLGTLIMFLNGNTSIPFEGAVFGSESVNEANKIIRRKNKRIQVFQRIGMLLLTASFLLQLLSLIPFK